MPVDMLAPIATAMPAQGQGIAGVAGRRQEGHESLGPHPASGKGSVHKEQRRAICLACRQAREDLQPIDFFGFYHCDSFVG